MQSRLNRFPLAFVQRTLIRIVCAIPWLPTPRPAAEVFMALARGSCGWGSVPHMRMRGAMVACVLCRRPVPLNITGSLLLL